MKIIPKFQQGSRFDLFMAVYLPILTPQPRYVVERPEKESKKKEKDEDDTKGKLTEKDMFKMMEDLDGLPNEMQAISQNFMRLFHNTRLLGSDGINDLATIYMSNLFKLKTAKFNKELFTDAYNRAVANNSLNDIAITNNGKILTIDKNTWKTFEFSPEEWAKVKTSNKYSPLTNSNILWMRAHMPLYINDNTILLTVQNGIGLETVHNMIKSRFYDIGKNESSTDVYIPKAAIKGLLILELMLSGGPEGYYKIHTLLSKTDANQINAVLSYIYTTLPPNAKTRLALLTKDGKPESVQSLIKVMILGSIDSKLDYSTQYLGTDEKLTNGSSSESGTLEGIKNTTPGMFIAGLGDKLQFVINAGTSASFSVNANVLPLTDDSDKPLGVQTTLAKAASGRYNGILDLQSVTMGGLLIDPMSFNKVVISDGKIASVDFPCTVVNGVVMPNITPDIVNKKLMADKQIIAKGINLNSQESIKANYQTINQIYLLNGLKPAYTSSGTPIPGTWARFGVLNGVASNKALNVEPTSDLPLLLADDNDYNRQSYLEITKTEEWDPKSFPWERDFDILYKGTIWIPVREDYVSAYVGSNVTMETANTLDAQSQAINKSSQLNLGRQLLN